MIFLETKHLHHAHAKNLKVQHTVAPSFPSSSTFSEHKAYRGNSALLTCVFIKLAVVTCYPTWLYGLLASGKVFTSSLQPKRMQHRTMTRNSVQASKGRLPSLTRKTHVLRHNRPSVCPRAAADLDVSPVPEGSCPIFYDNKGNSIQAMCADYGFRSGTGRLYQDHYGEVPKGVWQLAKENFQHELTQLRRSVRYNPYKEEVPPANPLLKAAHVSGIAASDAFASLDKWLEGNKVLPELAPPPTLSALETQEFKKIRARLDQLKLSVAGVVAEEEARIKVTGDMESPIWVKIPFLALCWVLDVVYDNKPIQKFWVLETVARIPYFAYISILHLYESLGFWRAGAELRKIHFAEEWNEMHHLQIMESLGGDRLWFDRFLAEHAAIAYYWVMIAYYLVSPKAAYNFMQRVELHAADTYSAFLKENSEVLATIPAPIVALNYYLNQDLYLFDEFQTGVNKRRPKCENLLDVFNNIRDDENEHVKTMVACQEETIAKDIAAREASRKKIGEGNGSSA